MLHRSVLPLLLLCWILPGHAQLQLVTEDEARASAQAPERPAPRSAPTLDGPRIEVTVPDVSKPVAVPTPIRVRFSAVSPAQPRPETFRVLYGMLGLDITARLLSVASATREGIDVSDATLPRGSHRLTMILQDTLGRESRHVVSFSVP
jgi:hypothetical protein